MTLHVSIPSISASVMSARVNPVTGGTYAVKTTQGDVFHLNFDTHRLVKNPMPDYPPTDLEQKFEAGKISRKAMLRSLDELNTWTAGFQFTSVCEVGRAAAIMLGSERILTIFMTELVADIQQVA